jgi:tripartite-type tricarboxylate transporter receptor subunit TctC
MANTGIKTALTALLVAVSLGIAAPVAVAQGYPTKPIKLVIGFGPGTGSDVLGRVIGTKLGEALGQTVVIENRAGAGGTIGSDSVAKATPDGYTVLLGTNAMLITSPLLMAQPPYHIEKDFVPVGGVARTSMVMVTGTTPESPKSVAEIVARARAAKTSFASAGNGTIGHLTTELVMKRMGLQVTHIPYKGSGQSLTDVARGEVLFASDTPAAALPLIRSGRLRAVAVTGESRLLTLPEVPTFAESGVKDVRLYAWWGLFLPVGTPRNVIDTLGQALGKVLADAETRKIMATMEVEPFPMSATDLIPFARSEYTVWQQFLSQSGIKLD